MKIKNLLVAALLSLIFFAACNGYTNEYANTYTLNIGQMMSHEFDSLQLSGKGIKIGVLDAGFRKFKTNKWTKNLHVAAYADFTSTDTAGFFNDEMDHGTRVCANIGGKINDTIRGLAYNSTYYLAKIDLLDKEPRSEEERMIAGIEWLLAHEVDIITSSITYKNFDDFDGYTPNMLNGNTSTVSKYLDSLLAVNKKVVFIQSAGNQGNKGWKYIEFPADVQNVITVGAYNYDNNTKMDYSGVGPEGVDYIKPDVVVGDSPQGTSFSTPVITGLCATILEYKKMSSDSLRLVLQSSGTNSATPNRKIGYGVPQTQIILKQLQ